MTEQYIEDKERQTKNRHGDDPTATKRVRNYNNKIWRTVGGERDPHRAFIEYVGHRPKGGNVPGNFYPSPVDSPKFNIWYKVVPIGRNTLGKQVQSIASIAPLDCQFTNSSGRKTIIQVLRDDFDHWRSHISELPGHANPESISSYSLNLLEKREIVLNCLAPPSNTAHTSNRDGSASRSIYLMEGAVGGMFTGVTFNNSPVNISINFQSNITWISNSL